MHAPSDVQPQVFSTLIAALRDEAGQLLGIRPIPANTGVKLLGLLYRAEALSAQRYQLLLLRLEGAPNEALQDTF
ncbi:hypothetical protein, partial [Acidocella aminolytica]